MKGKSIKGNLTEEIQAALQQGMAGGFKPTLASLKGELDYVKE
jgi:hypothetical protein